jgi:hypothetical protein
MPYFKNDDVNILFIHIPKTGGTSLEDYFSSKYNIPLNKDSLFMYLNKEKRSKMNISINSSLQHMTYQTILKYKKEFNVNFNDLQIITIVRNPYERIVSDLFYFKLINQNNSKDEVFRIIKNNYITRDDLDNHNIPQYLFITNSKNEIVPNINILNTETLTSDMHKLGYSDFDAEYVLEGFLRSNELEQQRFKGRTVLLVKPSQKRQNINTQVDMS